MRGGRWWARGLGLGLVLVIGGCWRANPAFLAGLDAGSSGGAGDTSGDPGMSSGTDTTGVPDTTGGPGTSVSGTTAVEPGTTSDGTDTGTGGTTGTSDPGTSTGGNSTDGGSTDGSSTGGPIDEATLCKNALAGDIPLGPPIVDMSNKPCLADWRGSDTQNPDVLAVATCGAPSPAGYALAKGGIPVNPGPMMFGPSMITGTQSLPGRTGTIEGVFSGIDLAGAAHPCFIARVACLAEQPGPCSLAVQIFIKGSQAPDWGVPFAEVAISDVVLHPFALPLAEFAGQPIDILLVVANDGVGAAQEIAAWERAWVAEALP